MHPLLHRLPGLRLLRDFKSDLSARPTRDEVRNGFDDLRNELIAALAQLAQAQAGLSADLDRLGMHARQHATTLPPVTVDDIRTLPRNELERLIAHHCRYWPLGDDTAMARILGGPLMLLDTRDYSLAPHLISTGFWEIWITQAMARVLRPGMTAVDVGANLGYYTVLMAQAVGPAGRVVACEPNPRLARLLRHTIELNGYAGFATVESRAASATGGQVVRLFVPRDRPMNASIRDDADGEAIEIRTVALQTVLPARVDFIKIDVEGAEQLVWEGLERTLAGNPGIQLFLEFNAARYPATAAAFLRRIRQLGFRTGHVDTDSEVKPCDDAFILSQGSNDVILHLQRP